MIIDNTPQSTLGTLPYHSAPDVTQAVYSHASCVTVTLWCVCCHLRRDMGKLCCFTIALSGGDSRHQVTEGHTHSSFLYCSHHLEGGEGSVDSRLVWFDFEWLRMLSEHVVGDVKAHSTNQIYALLSVVCMGMKNYEYFMSYWVQLQLSHTFIQCTGDSEWQWMQLSAVKLRHSWPPPPSPCLCSAV